jgi:hypothetical protein
MREAEGKRDDANEGVDWGEMRKSGQKYYRYSSLSR